MTLEDSSRFGIELGFGFGFGFGRGYNGVDLGHQFTEDIQRLIINFE